MALYPSYSSIQYSGCNIVERFKNIEDIFDEMGTEQVKRKWLFFKRTIALTYGSITKTEANTLRQFYIDRYGNYTAFNWFHHEFDTYVKEYVCTGDGVTLVFNLPSKQAQSYSVYINNALQTETTDYTISSEGGADGADQITFTSAPAAGEYVTFSFAGYLKVHCRFKDATFSEDFQHKGRRTVNVVLRGILNE